MKTILNRPYLANPSLQRLLKLITELGGRALLVGGCVRDHVLANTALDIDIEVYGLEAGLLEHALSAQFNVNAVGKAFGIFKVVVDGQSFDVALPRLENKAGTGHKGFIISPNPYMSFAQASLRRDFTINAMAIDVSSQELHDPHGGLVHLEQKTLRHVSEAFIEDPLRVFRAAQFCARFDLTLDSETLTMCQKLKSELSSLSRERVYQEMKKLLLSPQPSIGLSTLKITQAWELFPELVALSGCAQDPSWHPEGDVWVHTLMVVDQAAKLVLKHQLSEEDRLLVLAGALCHDLGKPITTIIKDGRIKSPGHEPAGIAPTKSFLSAIGYPKKWHEEIAALVAEHLKPFQLYAHRNEISDAAIRRLSTRVKINLLLLVSEADFLGRTTADALAGCDPSSPWLREKVAELLKGQTKPTPILQGRHLLAAGFKPGVAMGPILAQAFEAQLDGLFSTEEEALAWLGDFINDTESE